MSIIAATVSNSASAFSAVVTTSPRRHRPLPAGRHPASTSCTNGGGIAAGALAFVVV